MLEELCDEILDLTARDKGYRGALFAASADTPAGGCGSLTLCCTVVLCSCTHLCW